MSAPLCVTTHREGVGEAWQREWQVREHDALIEAGYEIKYPSSDVKTFGSEPEDYEGRNVLIRCYAGQEESVEREIVSSGGKLLVSRAWRANAWYRLTIPHRAWFGRDIGSIDMYAAGLADPETTADYRARIHFIKYVFERFARPIGGLNKVFFKGDRKGTLQSGLYTYREAEEAIGMFGDLNCHNRLTELIFSQPLRLAKEPEAVHGAHEFRAFMVDTKVATVSLMTDTPGLEQPYAEISRYCKAFAREYRHILPRAYCLDVAYDINGKLWVIELNGLGASGYFADHDPVKLFKAIAAGASA